MKKQIKKFTDLIVWQKAHSLLMRINELIGNFPAEEKFSLTNQIKRSAASIGANIAEGFGRYHYKENIQFCRQARGSLEETLNHLIVAKDFGYLEAGNFGVLESLCDEVRLLLNSYINVIKGFSQKLND